MGIDVSAKSLLEGLIVDDRERGIFRVNRRVFTDPEILALERERIFNKCWLYLGHTSELPKPASFVTRNVAGREILFNRDRDGGLNAFYNTCSHRGAMVCRERSGRRPSFQCPYHGFVFDDKGHLVHVPGEDALPNHINADGSLNLQKVPQLADYRGFVFFNFDRNAEGLDSYLADAKEYLSYVADQGEHGMEIVRGMQEYSAKANWKLLQENSADGYHAAVTHSTYFDYVKARDGNLPAFDPSITFGRLRPLGNGHVVGESIGAMPWGRPCARWVPGWGEDAKQEVAELARRTVERLGPERGRVVTTGDRNLLIFPNLVVNDIMAVTVRTYQPMAQDFFHITAWELAPIGESTASRDRRNQNYLEFLGPAGFATPDDVEMLEVCQRGYSNAGGAVWNDCSRGMHRKTDVKSDELQIRTYWRRWLQLMTGAENEVTGP